MKTRTSKVASIPPIPNRIFCRIIIVARSCTGQCSLSQPSVREIVMRTAQPSMKHRCRAKVDNCVYRNRSVSCRKCIFRSFALTIRQMSHVGRPASVTPEVNISKTLQESASIRGIPQSCDFLQNYCAGVRTYRGRTKSLIGQSTGLKRY
jgi:hypothetical protein